MILRDHEGQVIFVACRALRHCADPLEAELAACEEGIRLALHWTQSFFTLESDRSEAVSFLQNHAQDRSKYAHLVQAILELLTDERRIHIQKISRAQNKASHGLAAFGRSQQRTACWLGNVPIEIQSVIDDDCDTIINSSPQPNGDRRRRGERREESDSAAMSADEAALKACDERTNLSVAASYQAENGFITTVGPAESEKAAYAFLPQTPTESTDTHLVEFAEAMRTVAQALRQVAEGKAAAQAEAAEWKRKYELEKAVKAHKHHSVIKGCSNCVKDKLEHLASKLTLETALADQTGCCGDHGICSRQILQDQSPGPNQKLDDKIVGRKAPFRLSWGCNEDKNGQHKHDFVSFEKGDITTAERSNKQILLKWESPPQTVLFVTKPNSNAVHALCSGIVRYVSVLPILRDFH
ncbi:hypothetical protein ACQ4PT_037658 [Festuca glaucescens]